MWVDCVGIFVLVDYVGYDYCFDYFVDDEDDLVGEVECVVYGFIEIVMLG